MMERAIALGLALVAGVGSGSAGAMTNLNPAAVECSVLDAGKLPAGLDAGAICAAIRAAVQPALAASATSRGALSVKVTVVSESKMVAVATFGGKALPEHHVASSDRPLNARTVDMLAEAIAADIPAHGRVSGA